MSTLKFGSRGDEVKYLQSLLGGLTVDGIFGKLTQSAVIAYQSANGLNPDGIVGALTWAKLTGKPTYVQPVDYKQYDKRWAGNMYSNHNDKAQTLKSSGCGPTAMADIVATLIDPSATPPTLAEKALAWGDRSYSNGTNWSFFEHVAREYGFASYTKTASLSKLKACLDAGGYAVASMGKGYWTSGGHYICVWMYDDNYIYANDPASAKRTKQKIADFMNQRRMFFCFIK